jgi:hypothetical protein
VECKNQLQKTWHFSYLKSKEKRELTIHQERGQFPHRGNCRSLSALLLLKKIYFKRPWSLGFRDVLLNSQSSLHSRVLE